MAQQKKPHDGRTRSVLAASEGRLESAADRPNRNLATGSVAHDQEELLSGDSTEITIRVRTDLYQQLMVAANERDGASVEQLIGGLIKGFLDAYLRELDKQRLTDESLEHLSTPSTPDSCS